MLRQPYRSLAAITLFASAVATPVIGASIHTATVLETMDSGGYTYVKVDEGGKVYWAAAPAAQVAVGDQVSFSEQMTMVNFTSPSLNRTFEQLMFVGGLSGGSGAHGAEVAAPAVAVVSEPIAKAEGGYTIAEVFDRKEELKGTTVRVLFPALRMP